MRTKKHNRGLLIGAALIIGMGGYIVIDRINFKSNKSDIEAAVQSYLNDAAAAGTVASSEQKEAYKKVIDDHWGYNKFFDENFLTSYGTASVLREETENKSDEDFGKGSISECTVKIEDIKVSKAGPNLAKANVSYSINFKAKGHAQLITLDRISDTVFDSYTFEEAGETQDTVEKLLDEYDFEYTGTVHYDDYTGFYLEYEGGDWKIVGVEGYADSFSLSDADGKELNMQKLQAVLSGESEKEEQPADEQGKNDESSSSDEPEAQDMPEADIKTQDSMPAPADSTLKNGGDGNA